MLTRWEFRRRWSSNGAFLAFLLAVATSMMMVVVRSAENEPTTTFASPDSIVIDAEGRLDKVELKAKAKEMFMHGYNGYMKYAFPHDELMPISCKGRERGVTPGRGDVDDSLGNFSLTLVDTLDTLVVVGEYDEFERAVRQIVDIVRFDADLVVSVFETNIRMVGGLISGHLMGVLLKAEQPARLLWYTDQLLMMASELADRLLPAFNTTSGVPHSRVNLKHGLPPHLKSQQDTCTACGGTMILEWAALSRLTGNPVYEAKARRAMDFLWNQRNRGSDLMGTVLNVNSGDWIRRDSGIGAGIDSYYEYTLKAYILLGEEDYLYRFNKHYDAVMRYLSKGPMFIDVHMHKPNVASRSFMDALLAFWPGVQVLKGDLKSAIELHEMLYNVVKKHKFLPDAFTHDLQVHWGQHPLRPEFIESTYFLYRATKDPHYLEVAKQVMMSLEENVRTSCGFAAVKDVRTMEREDQMESFVLAETFKYLYMIFAEPTELLFDPDNYVLTTEAHFLPLTIGESSSASAEDLLPRRMLIDPDEIIEDGEIGNDDGTKKRRFKSACPNVLKEIRNTKELHSYGVSLRDGVSKLFNNADGSTEFAQSCSKANERLKAWSFSADNTVHLAQLKKMGIEVEIHSDGRLQLSHSTQAVDSSLIQSPPSSSSSSAAFALVDILNDVAISCAIGVESAVAILLAHSANSAGAASMGTRRASKSGNALLYEMIAGAESLKSSKAALINATGMILLVFVMWAVLLFLAVVVIFAALVGYRAAGWLARGAKSKRSKLNGVENSKTRGGELMSSSEGSDSNSWPSDDGSSESEDSGTNTFKEISSKLSPTKRVNRKSRRTIRQADNEKKHK